MSSSCLSYVPARPDERRRDALWLHGGWLAISAAVLAASAILSVRGDVQVVVPLVDWPLPGLCAVQETLRIDCPGCGLTRCFVSLAHGDWRAAWRFHPTGILLFAAAVFQIPYRAVQLWRLARGADALPGFALLWLLAPIPVLMIVQWLVRVTAALW
jgi:hypothetical protein